MRVFVYGAGKVGKALAREARRAGLEVTLRAARRGLPKASIDAALVILAVRDSALASVVSELASRRLLSRSSVCVHCAGSLGPDPLGPLRASCLGVAQMHPMVSFASSEATPPLLGASVHVIGDAPAMRRARAFAKRLSMKPRTIAGLDFVAYHAAASLVANGAAALAAAGAELLRVAGVPEGDVAPMLGPLLASVAHNVAHLGLPGALTGPVRRGDAAAVARQLDLVRAKLPLAAGLLAESVRAQLPMARALGEASARDFDAVARLVSVD